MATTHVIHGSAEHMKALMEEEPWYHPLFLRHSLTEEELRTLDRLMLIIKSDCQDDFIQELLDENNTYPLHCHKYLKGRMLQVAMGCYDTPFIKGVTTQAENTLKSIPESHKEFLENWRSWQHDDEPDELPPCYAQDDDLAFHHHEELCQCPPL
jgi:hypothetical protein